MFMPPLLFGVGVVLVLVGWIWLLVMAFQEGILWGLGMLCLGPIVGLIYSILHWQQARSPFLTYVAGLGALAAARMMGFEISR